MTMKRAHYQRSLWPFIFIAPQVIITLVFFIYPALSALEESLFRGDAFGIHRQFIWLENFIDIFRSNYYLHSFFITIIFSLSVALSALIMALVLAVMVTRVVRGKGIYKTLLIWPYAVAPAVAGILWRFLFNPAIGVISNLLDKFGYHWDYTINGHQALLLVVIAAAWQQFSYNFVFFIAGLQAIPKSLIEAAAIDGAGPFKRFWTILFPLLAPTTFFLMIMNLIYSFFNTFGVIQVVTQGGPAGATNILVYKVYNDGFVGLNLGGSSAQSVVLMAIVIVLTVIQFRYIEKKVHY